MKRIPASAAGTAAIAAVREVLKERGDGFELSVADRRAQLLEFARSRPPSEGITTHEDMLGSRRAMVFTPPNDRGQALLLHGGAFVLGSPETHHGLAAAIARTSSLAVHLLDYRLAPEHPYPAAIQDALSAATAIADRFSNWVLVGDSAGGGLALALLIALQNCGARLPAKAALISPWLDLTLSAASMDDCAADDAMLSRRGLAQDAGRYAPGLDLSDPRISPLFADLTGLPPILLQVGGRELLRDDSLRLAERIDQAGGQVELQLWEEMTHAWFAFSPTVPEADAAILSLGEWLGAGDHSDDPA
jgi:acetyl esterase/lipase